MSNTMSAPRTGEPRLASIASWAVLAASFGLSATTWIELAELAGFTGTLTIPALDRAERTEPETAEALGITVRTVQRDWVKARVLLRRALDA